MQKRQKRQKKSRPPVYRRLRVYTKAALFGGIASGAALVLFSLLVFLLRLPVAHSGFFSLLAFGIGCLVAGFTSGSMKRCNGLTNGIKAALLFTLPVVTVGLVTGLFALPAEIAPAGATAAEAASSMPAVVNKVITAVLCGAAGGVAGVNKNNGF
jgi:hypothetical protein